MVRIAKVIDFSLLYQILNRKRFIHIDMVFFFHLVETMYSYRVYFSLIQSCNIYMYTYKVCIFILCFASVLILNYKIPTPDFLLHLPASNKPSTLER